MSSAHNNSDPLSSIERSLAGFTPAPPQVERDRLMFLAGQANSDRRAGGVSSYIWPTATVAFATSSLILAATLFLRPEPAARIVYRDRPVAAPARPVSARSEPLIASVPAPSREAPAPRVPDNHYLQTREVALRMGLDALGSPSRASDLPSPISYGDLLFRLSAGAMSPTSAEIPLENRPNM
jgi:hypothetical protein